jgi:MFS family permease
MRRRLRQAGAQTFRALRVRNFRLYFVGQVISVSGTWMQTVALGLLILSDRLHGNGFDVGAATALQYLPMLLFGTFGGVVADRVDKRRLLLVTQAVAGVLALALGLLTGLHVVRMWEVIGPAVGGLLIYTVGFAACFFVNAGSYVAVIVALLLMRMSDLYRSQPVARAKGQVREGLRYVWRTPGLRDPLLVMAVVGTLAFNFTTTLPLLAEYTFHGGAGTYSTFTAAMGTGAIVGGLLVAHRSRPSTGLLSMIGLAFGAMIALAGLVPTEPLTVVALVAMGVCSISFIATANATLQLTADPSMRGRVMSLYAIAFLGSTPIGAPLMGWISDSTSPRVALVVGAVGTVAASSLLARRWLRRGAIGRGVAVPVSGSTSPSKPADHVAWERAGGADAAAS